MSEGDKKTISMAANCYREKMFTQVNIMAGVIHTGRYPSQYLHLQLAANAADGS